MLYTHHVRLVELPSPQFHLRRPTLPVLVPSRLHTPSSPVAPHSTPHDTSLPLGQIGLSPRTDTQIGTVCGESSGFSSWPWL